MNTDQEIRTKAIEIRANFIAQVFLGCLIANRSFEASMWEGNELDDICEYIKTGKKPETEVAKPDVKE